MTSGRKASEAIYFNITKKGNIAAIQGGGPIFDKIPFKEDDIRINVELKNEEVYEGIKHHIFKMTPTLKKTEHNYKLSPKGKSYWQISSISGEIGHILSTYGGKRYEHVSCDPIHTDFGDMYCFNVDLDDIPQENKTSNSSTKNDLPNQCGIDYDKLAEIIYESVRRALNDGTE